MKKIDFMLWMRGQLTPEQKQQLKTIMQNKEGTAGGSEEGGDVGVKDVTLAKNVPIPYYYISMCFPDYRYYI